MKSKVLILTSLLLIATSFVGQSQNTGDFTTWTDSTLLVANSALNSEYLSDQEKQVVFYTNLIRINPALFAQTYLLDYLKEKDIKKDKTIKDLITQLETTKSMEALVPHHLLTEVARNHAKDMGASGRTGHISSDGTSFQDRMTIVSLTFNGVNENANYGQENALDIVMDLLIDRDVPNVGHRKNILDKNMKFIGAAIEPHKKWGINCVQDFAGPLIN